MCSNRLLRGAIRLALLTASSAAVLSLAGPAAAADQPAAAEASPPEELQTVVVTGSSIKQNLENSPLPVIAVTADDIAKTGYTSITDLVQNLPAVQGFVAPSSSVNGGGAGVTTVALHSLPSKYTLVLIDGQRVAPFTLSAIAGGGFGVNVESIPLSAIERVELLADGASAVYGADAVAGVVNFITKKNQTDGNVFYHVSAPDQPGGGAWNAGLSKGFGDLNTDGYNILFAYSHDVQNKLQASDRAVSARGASFPFSFNGQNYMLFAPTSNTAPANIILSQANVAYNPFYVANGNCGNANAFPLTTAQGTTCRFNYAATVEDIPGSLRDSGLIKATFKANDNTTVWVEALLTDFTLRSQYAPPAQPLGVSATQLPALWNTYVVPYLTAHGLTGTVTHATLGYRAVAAGGRSDDWSTQSRQLAVGFDSTAWGWDLHGMVVQSHGKAVDTAAGGYLDFAQFQSAVASGAYDPVMEQGASSIQAAILHSQLAASYSDITQLNLNAQHHLFELGGGDSVFSLGAEYDLTKYKIDYSDLELSQSGFSSQPAATDFPIGGSFGLVPFFASRNNWGVYSELLLPFRKDLTVTAAVRYDSYAKVYSDTVFGVNPDPATGLIPEIAPADLGNTFADTTFNISGRWTPLNWLSFRGSVGTGFRAPALTDIAGALGFAGSTAGTYGCPFPGSPGCLPGSAQYDLVAGPNSLSGDAGLKPEKSTQYTFGIRFLPVDALSLAFDYWRVKVTNQVESQGIAEQVAFNNPGAYTSLFINPYQDPAGFTTIALEQVPFNGGVANYSGIDWDITYRLPSPIGQFGIDWTGTYMLTQNYTDGPGLPELTDLGVYGPDQQVVFRIQSQLRLSLQSGRWTNTLLGHFKSGYTDAQHSAGEGVIFLAGPNGTLGAPTDFPGLKIGSFATFDWQSALAIGEKLNLAVGVTNLTSKKPPLSLQTGGGGNQIGYDGRYYDPTGRAYYLRVDYKF